MKIAITSRFQCIPIAIIAVSIVDAKKAFLGVVNIDKRIVYAGIGIIYGENPVGKSAETNANARVNTAIIGKYFEL
jgi:hypothetical protein